MKPGAGRPGLGQEKMDVPETGSWFSFAVLFFAGPQWIEQCPPTWWRRRFLSVLIPMLVALEALSQTHPQ